MKPSIRKYRYKKIFEKVDFERFEEAQKAPISQIVADHNHFEAQVK